MTTEEEVRAAKMAVAGQRVVNAIGDEISDIEDVLTVLASVAGHYLGGIAVEEVRKAYFAKFGGLTLVYTMDNAKSGTGAKIDMTEILQ
jgi:hypothetical protein